MKRCVFILVIILIPSLTMAQASGGQIVRKAKVTKSNSSQASAGQITRKQQTQETINVKKQKANKESSTTNDNNHVERKIQTKVINVSCRPIVTNTHKWDLSVIILSDNQTILRKYVTPKSAKSRICSTKNEYIEDISTGQKYYILKSDIGFEPKDIEGTKATYFNEIYPVLPEGVEYVNISSGTDFFVRNLKIR